MAENDEVERKIVTVGMVRAALEAIGELDVSLNSARHRQVTKMIQAALDWRPSSELPPDQ